MMFHDSVYFALNQLFVHQVAMNVIVCQDIAKTQRDPQPGSWRAELCLAGKPGHANLLRLFSLAVSLPLCPGGYPHRQLCHLSEAFLKVRDQQCAAIKSLGFEPRDSNVPPAGFC